MRSICSGGKCARSNSPEPVAATRTPSIRIRVWLELAPRRKIVDVWPGPPVRATSMPAYCPSTLIRSGARSEEHTSELQSLMRISYAVFCLKKKKTTENETHRESRKNYNNTNSTHRKTETNMISQQ